jgi:hypothetical protein
MRSKMSRYLRIVALSATALTATHAALATTLTSKVSTDNGYAAYIPTDDSVPGTLFAIHNDWFTTFVDTATLNAGTTHYSRPRLPRRLRFPSPSPTQCCWQVSACWVSLPGAESKVLRNPARLSIRASRLRALAVTSGKKAKGDKLPKPAVTGSVCFDCMLAASGMKAE